MPQPDDKLRVATFDTSRQVCAAFGAGLRDTSFPPTGELHGSSTCTGSQTLVQPLSQLLLFFYAIDFLILLGYTFCLVQSRVIILTHGGLDITIKKRRLK